MRLNKWLVEAGAAPARRAADELIKAGGITVDGQPAELGTQVESGQRVELNGQPLIIAPSERRMIALHKPRGVVSSHRRQGKEEIVTDLLPPELRSFKFVGRLDRESEGLMLLTNDGEVAYTLTHPKHEVRRVYEVELDSELTPAHRELLLAGMELEDGLSSFLSLTDLRPKTYRLELQEGRNRQIRRTLGALGYDVVRLKRVSHGPYELGTLASGDWEERKFHA